VFGEQSQFGTIATSASVLLLKPLVYVKPFSVARGGKQVRRYAKLDRLWD